MGLAARLLAGERRQGRAPWDDFWYRPVGFYTGGVEVTRNNVLGLTAAWKAVRLLSADMGKMPLKLYRTRPDGGRDEARDDPRFWLLHLGRPNPWQTPFRLKEMLEGHLDLRGNAFAQIVPDRAGRILGIVPLHPDRVRITTVAGALRYEYQRPNAGGMRTFEPQEILHLRGLSDDGVMGYDPLTVLAESFSTSILTQRFASKFYENDASPGIALQTDQTIDDEVYKRMADSWEGRFGGVDNSHKPVILEAGVQIQQLGITAENAQMIEARNLSAAEIARAFGVPPHKIGASTGDSQTYQNIESMQIEYVTDAIQSRAERWEQELNLAMLTEQEIRDGLYWKFNLLSLLRADSGARASYLEFKFRTGAASSNDIRRYDDENPYPGGDEHYVGMNMVPVGQAASFGAGRSVEPSAEARSLPEAREERAHRSAVLRNRHRLAYAKIIESRAATVVKQEVEEARAALDRAFGSPRSRNTEKWLAKRGLRAALGSEIFRAWMEEFYRNHADQWNQAVRPTFGALADTIRGAVVDELGSDPDQAPDDGQLGQFVDDYAQTMADAKVRSSVNQLNAVLDENRDAPDDQVQAALSDQLDNWEQERAARVADRESAQLANAAARFVMLGLGVTLFRWTTIGDSCGYCQQLDGVVVGKEEHFLDAGQTLTDEGGGTFEAKQLYRHAPLHRGCDCQITAG